MTLHEWAPLHDYATDLTIGDRVRSSLGPLLKKLDQPRVHVMVVDGVATLHGDVTNGAARAEIKSCTQRVPGVCGVRSHLFVGPLESDTLPSGGRSHRRSRLSIELNDAAHACGFWSEAAAKRALAGLLGVFALRLEPSRRRVFTEHLPRDVRPLAEPPAWLDDDMRLIRREHDFAQIVALAICTDVEHADRFLRRVLPVLRRHAPQDAHLIGSGLPPQLHAIWAGHPCAGSTARAG